MKTLKILPLIFLIFSCEQREECDYIEDYYQLIYQAEVHYLKEENQKAYDLIKKVEEKCTLLNQTAIYEPRMMAELCVRLDKKEEAFPYLYMLFEHGMKFSFINDTTIFEPLKEMPQWKELENKAPKLEEAFLASINQELRNEIIEMNIDDQLVRGGDIDFNKLQKTDSVNQARIKEILKTYGFPNDKHIGPSTMDEHTELTAMFMHFDDTTYFKPILLNYVRRGEAPPRTLPSMIDRKKLGVEKFTYGIYNNSDSTQIKDFKNIDTRRVSVGLRPYALEKEYWQLIQEKYGF